MNTAKGVTTPDTPVRRLPREERQEVVASMRESGMSYPAISSATGVSVGAAHAAVQSAQAFTTESLPSRTQGTDGKSYAARVDDVIDADLVDKPARPEPPKQKRRPLPESFNDAGRGVTAEL